MKYIITFLFAIAFMGTSWGQNSINFEEGNWQSILDKAKTEDKIIFLDAYASWCGPCKKMSKEVFTHAEVGQYYNDNFINAKIDMEKGEGVELARTYKVRAYPTLLFIDAGGSLVHQAIGYHNPKQFFELGSTALNPSNRLSSLSQRYVKGERDPEFLYKYTRASMNAMDDKATDIAEAYFATQKDWKTPRNMELIMDVAQTTDSDFFDFILDNRTAFDELYGKELVAGKIQEMIINSIADSEDDGVLKKVESLYQKAYPDNAPLLIANFKMNYFGMIGDKDEFAQAAIDYMDDYGSEDYDELNNVAWAFYETVDNKDHLKKAIEWAEKSTQLNDLYYNNDTLAALHYKVGNKKKAKKVAKKAIKIAKANGEDYSLTADLLEQIKAL
jgi:thioredoxin-related protein